MNLFQIVPNDASMSYLSQVFGNVSGVININGSSLGESVTMLSTMFKTFNSIVLVVGVLTLVYVTVVGVLATAHEGEFLGRKWNNIWIPIRLVVGFALLVPTGAGYAGIQILMMWVIVQGVGAADTLWNTALSYVNIVGSPYAQFSVPGVSANQALSGLFQGLVCDASARMKADDPTNPGSSGSGSYYCHGSTDTWCGGAVAFNPNANSLSLGPSGGCGSLTYCNQTSVCAASGQSSMACLGCQAQVTALQGIVPTLSGIAQQLVNADYSYRDFWANSALANNNGSWGWIQSYCSSQSPAIPRNKCCVGSSNPASAATCQAGIGLQSGMPNVNETSATGDKPQNPSSDAVSKIYWPYWPQLEPNLGTGTNFINTAVNYYTDLAKQALTTFIAAQGQNQSNLNGSLSAASDKGWILAGAYYYTMANMNSSNFKAALPNITWNAPNLSTTPMGNFRNNMDASMTLISAAAGAGNNYLGNSSALAGANGAVTSALSTVTTSFTNTVSGSQTNPIIAIQAIGETLLVLSEFLFMVVLGVVIGLALAGNIDVFIFGSGAVDPLGPMLNVVLMFLIPLIYAVLGIMITLGGLLAVYTPLIPYIVFAVGALGWLISTIEAMVAGPLVALQVMMPSEHQGPLGKAEGALMLLFNIFLRPSLMIFGMVAAMLLAPVAVSMVNAGFWITFQSIHTFDPIGIIMMIGAYVMLILAVLNKCFAVINIIPQQVMSWIGGQGTAVETAEALGGAKGGMEAVGGKAGGGMGAAGDTTKGALKAKMESKAAAEEAGAQVAKTGGDLSQAKKDLARQKKLGGD